MIAKEIAEKLVSDFYSINSKLITPKNMNDLANRYNLVMPISKQCALTSVEFARQFITGDLSETFDKTMYLFDIKQEIEKL